MDVNKIVIVEHRSRRYVCRFYRVWNGIPVFVAHSGKESLSALYQDGTSFIVISIDLLQLWTEPFIANRLWHEVSHLYYKDIRHAWDIRFDYRADLVASAATGTDVTRRRLCRMRRYITDDVASAILDQRLKLLDTSDNPYTTAFLFEMLARLQPVSVL